MTSPAEPGYRAPDVTLVGPEHIARYEETNGEVGHEWNGATCLVLTTTGRITGQPRKSALIYAQDGDSYVVVASKGGAPSHPLWYRNLADNSDVMVQVLDRKFAATASTAEGPERERLWKVVTAVWPNYDVYTTRTDRLIPVVVLSPAAT
jgi:deazaflavin-dependent oxidoreductase (nitroreductase family)